VTENLPPSVFVRHETVQLGVPQCARIAGVPIFDYGPDRGQGLLVAGGTGLMLSLMDQCRSLRWCVDYDLVADERAKEWFLRLVDGEAWPLVVAGWWTVTKPGAIARGLSALRHRWRVVTHSNRDFGMPNLTLDELIWCLQGWTPRPDLQTPTLRVRCASSVSDLAAP